MDDPHFPTYEKLPIDDAARNGSVILVNRGDDYAAAYWTGDMWAYRQGRDCCVVQLDFEPTHWLRRPAE